jgi:AraC family transcriptional regulator, transcriptional activator of pobA
MHYKFHDPAIGGYFLMTTNEHHFSRNFFQDKKTYFNAIIWNRGADQIMTLENMRVEMPSNTFFALNVSHSFRLEKAEDAIIWQFNKEFYCIVTHDAEVSCAGLLFYGWRANEPIFIEETDIHSFGLLAEVFKEEFQNQDTIQGEMLRVLLKRLIIKLTRLVKVQTHTDVLNTNDLDIIRQFNLLVENNYKQLHQVQDYAVLLHKSPKTLSNLFSKYSDKTPLQIIAERIFLESKRLLMYTDQSAQAIGFELGFMEAAHFSRFFKKMSGGSPMEFRKLSLVG